MRVLIVEDEQSLARGLRFNLQQEGIDAVAVTTGEEALQRWLEFDLMVLDLSLPGIDGLEVLRQVRGDDERFPVIILTARAGEDDRVTGLQLGADDYIVKPFSLREFLLRVQGKLRQSSWYRGERRNGKLKVGLALFDLDGPSVERDGQSARLTAREEALVRYFVDHPHTIISRDELLTQVWGYTLGTASRTPDTFIARLRKWVEPDLDAPRYIVSVRGRGYLYRPDGVEA